MIDLLFQMGLSNACFSTALALLAMIVGATTKRPHLAHMLWLLVFVKLLTPPIVTIPIAALPGDNEAVTTNRPQPPSMHRDDFASSRPVSGSTTPANNDFDFSQTQKPLANHPDPNNSHPVWAKAEKDNKLSAEVQPPSKWSTIVFAAVRVGRSFLPFWFVGSVVVFAWSLVRVFRFGKLLKSESDIAPQELQDAAVKLARRLKLKKVPELRTTSAHLSPMVWWTGGKVRVVIPAMLLEQMSGKQWQWILAHELAHVRRRDYLVRWLEWLTCVCFWWNPVVWWAQRNLRATEEICCDALVMSSLKPKPHSYANSLLTAVEFLARPAFRPPAMASEINSGGFLERRIRMIVADTPNRTNSRWLQATVLLCAVVVLPFGLAQAQDLEAVHHRLKKAVEAGELSKEQAHVMLGALKKTTAKKQGDKRELHAHLEHVWKELQSAVAAGKISKEQAHVKMEAIKRAKLGGGEQKKPNWDEIKRHIEGAVKAGKMTRDQADAKYRHIKEHFAHEHKTTQTPHDQRELHAYFAQVWKELQAAVAAGKISKEQAHAKMEAIKRAKLGGGAQKKPNWDEIKRHIEGAVKAGKMTREQADAKYRHIKEHLNREQKTTKAHHDERELHAYFARVWGELQAAVAAGKITQQEAHAKMDHVKREKGIKSHEPRDKGNQTRELESHFNKLGIGNDSVARVRHFLKEKGLHEEQVQRTLGGMLRDVHELKTKGVDAKLNPRLREYFQKEVRLNDDQVELVHGLAVRLVHGLSNTDRKTGDDKRLNEYRAIEARVRAAVEAGKLSREDAGKKLIEVRKHLLANEQKSKGDEGRNDSRREAFARRLKEAVSRGDLSEKDARAKWEALEKEAGKRGADGEEGEAEDDAGVTITALPAEVAQKVGEALLKVSPYKNDFPADTSKSVGIVGVDDEVTRGIILVPPKDMKEAEMEIGETKPLALLFCSASISLGDDDARQKMHQLSVTDGQGKEHKSNCVRLVVKRISEEDFRLYGIGKEPHKPLFGARFVGGKGPGNTPLAIEIKDIDTENSTASAVITVFDKYQAAFRVGVVE